MRKGKTRTVYYARKLLTLRKGGMDVGMAQPGELVDVAGLGLSRGEIRMLVEDARALSAVEIDEDEAPVFEPGLDDPAGGSEEGNNR